MSYQIGGVQVSGKTVREALEHLIDRASTPEEIEVEYIAVKVEAALRAAYEAGRLQKEMLAPHRANSDHGVTAGIEKLGE